MGRFEWGIFIETKTDLSELLWIINEHNRRKYWGMIGEELELCCVFKFDNKICACISNNGGREETSEFLNFYIHEKNILFPFNKPSKWYVHRDYLWQKQSSKSPNSDDLWKLISK